MPALLAVGALLWGSASAAGQDLPPGWGRGRQDSEGLAKLKAFSVTLHTTSAKSGEVVTVFVDLEVEPRWHIYAVNKTQELGKPTVFSFTGPVQLHGPIKEPEPKEYRQKDLEEYLQWIHEGKIRFEIPLLIRQGAPEGKVRVEGAMSFQACEEQCVDGVKEFGFEITVLPGRVEPPPAQPAPVQPPVPASGDVQAEGFFAFILLCVGGGLLSLVMPCVYPLIPVTVTYFIKQGAGNRAKTVLLSNMYGLGIVITFTALGLILAAILGEQGGQIFASNPWVNLAIGALFVAFALSLFGLFEIKLPDALTSAVAGQQRSGAGGAFILGLTFAVVTFTCTIPIAATILAVAASGNYAWAVSGMLVYSVTMALPFFALGLFPGLLASIPRSGGWLHEAKIAAGFLEVGLAMKYLANSDFAWGTDIISRDFGIVLWTVCLALTALYLLGIFRWKEDTKIEGVSFPRVLLAGLFAVLALFFYTGVGSRSLGALEAVLPYDAALEGKDWLDDYDKAALIAKKEKKPIFIDFTGFS